MVEDLLNHHRVFNAGDDFHHTASVATCFNIDIKDALESLRPGHGRAARGLGLILRFVSAIGFVALASLGWRYQSAVLAVRGKHAVETGEVDARFGHQRCQPGDEVQRLKDHVRRAVPVRCLELVTNVAIPFRVSDSRFSDTAGLEM